MTDTAVAAERQGRSGPPRAENIAVVDEVRERLSSSAAAILTEYRGLTVAELETLRRSLRQAGGEYKVYKNTLVRFATRDLGLELDALLEGPTAITFVETDVPGVAKALRDFSRGNPLLVVKGGVMGTSLLSSADASALADIPPRDVLLARLAGLMAAPLQQLAGLLQALPRNLAYGLQALIDQRGGAPEATPDAEAPPAAEATPDAEPPAAPPDIEAVAPAVEATEAAPEAEAAIEATEAAAPAVEATGAAAPAVEATEAAAPAVEAPAAAPQAEAEAPPVAEAEAAPVTEAESEQGAE
jgi:large subunit ribosomal protein L10